MYRFYVTPEQIRDEKIEIVGEDVNHIRNVLRMRRGEKVVLCDGDGTDYICELAQTEGKSVIADILEKKASETELPVKLVLFQGLPKKDKMELIIQKAVELGAAEIIPVITRRTIVKTDEGKEEKKLQRWQAIAESAAKQSERGRIPQVGRILTWKEALARMKQFDYNGILYENARGMRPTAEFVKKAVNAASIGILVGPEGGFEECEVEQAVEAGAERLSLGSRILRTETAGFTMLSTLMLSVECSRD